MLFVFQPRLRSVLRNPDADQLLRMLFDPLRLIVDASRDDHGMPFVAPKVVSPLLTSDACTMMETSLNALELALWRSLGPSWTIPRLKFIC